MSLGLGVEGVTELDARLTRARAGILDLSDANRDIATTVERQSTADAPRASGAMADSATIHVTSDGWSVTYGREYSGFVHWGTRYMRPRPWVLDAARRTEDTWMDQLTDHVQQLLD